MTATVTFRMTRADALRAGLLICECGHRPNNHFNFRPDDTPCGHCPCGSYRERAVWGELVTSEEE